jgi:hypothetical protein
VAKENRVRRLPLLQVTDPLPSIDVYQSDKHNAGSYSDQIANSPEDATGGKDGESKI